MSSNDASPAGSDDLSKDVAAAMARGPGETVRCARVAANRYRVNWWAAEDAVGYDNPKMKGGQLATTHRIVKSQYVEVTRAEGDLKIRVISSGAS